MLGAAHPGVNLGESRRWRAASMFSSRCSGLSPISFGTSIIAAVSCLQGRWSPRSRAGRQSGGARSFHACSPRHRSASRGEHPSRALEPSRGTRRSPPGAFDPLRLETLDEGRCVQILHVGSYEDEAPMLRRLHEEYLPRNGFAPDGKHHEIHPGDVRRTPPAKLRTIIPRQPARVSKAGA